MTSLASPLHPPIPPPVRYPSYLLFTHHLQPSRAQGLGVLAVLDDQCRFPKATDETFCNKLKESLASHR